MRFPIAVFFNQIKLIFCSSGSHWQLDMSTPRRCLKSPRSLSGTSAHPTMVTLVNIMVMNGWLKSFFHSLSIGHPIPEIRLFQTLTLKFQGQGHRCGQWSRSYSQPSILLIHFLFISHQSDQKIPEMHLFRNLTFKHPRSGSWVRSKVKVTYYTKYPTDALPFRFTSIGSTIPEILSK